MKNVHATKTKSTKTKKTAPRAPKAPDVIDIMARGVVVAHAALAAEVAPLVVNSEQRVLELYRIIAEVAQDADHEATASALIAVRGIECDLHGIRDAALRHARVWTSVSESDVGGAT